MIEPGAEEEGYRSAEVCVRNELGLHARPAARLAQEAQRFDAEIRLATQDQEVDAKSILDILTLAAPQGCGLTLRANGHDATEALAALIELFRTRFGEEK
ncbi:phosphocarrier protein [Desulfobaculum xiamenense]|uniref:Phosphocarrier protein n=1 Tax=Desulfobaculum xiamenense TaxID=995050 RepID=A0A846QK77_9BACT|nr:phosphocarrier protein [Desulfobaculum xiamenense]